MVRLCEECFHILTFIIALMPDLDKGNIYFFLIENTGKNSRRAMIEKINPIIVPTAKSNQKTSSGPSIRNGIKLKIVERTVKDIGTIFLR